MAAKGEVTRILQRVESGDQNAVSDLLPMVYAELRQLAASYMQRERPDHTLQPTALVHEAYLKLVDQTRVNWKGGARALLFRGRSADAPPPGGSSTASWT